MPGTVRMCGLVLAEAWYTQHSTRVKSGLKESPQHHFLLSRPQPQVGACLLFRLSFAFSISAPATSYAVHGSRTLMAQFTPHRKKVKLLLDVVAIVERAHHRLTATTRCSSVIMPCYCFPGCKSRTRLRGPDTILHEM